MAKSKYSRRGFLKHNSLSGFGAIVAMGVTPSLFAEDGSSAQKPASLSRKEEIVKTTPQKSRLMSGHTYYIDPMAGDDANNGLTPSLPFKTYAPPRVQRRRYGALQALPLFIDEAGGDYRQRNDSPCRDMGIQTIVRRKLRPNGPPSSAKKTEIKGIESMDRPG